MFLCCVDKDFVLRELILNQSVTWSCGESLGYLALDTRGQHKKSVKMSKEPLQYMNGRSKM